MIESREQWEARMLRETEGMTRAGDVVAHLAAAEAERTRAFQGAAETAARFLLQGNEEDGPCDR